MTEQALPTQRWSNIVIQVLSNPIGAGGTVVCDDCNGAINTGDRARAYIVGRNLDWKVSRVYHPDCDDNPMTVEKVGQYDEQEGIVFGEVTPLSEGTNPETETGLTIDEMASKMGVEPSVVKLPEPEDQLTDIELGAVYVPGEGIYTSVD